MNIKKYQYTEKKTHYFENKFDSFEKHNKHHINFDV